MKQLRLVISVLFLSCLFMLNSCSSGGNNGSKNPPAPPTPGSGIITEFSINGATGIIAGNNITVTLPFGTNLTALAATFTAPGSAVFIGKTPQVSGVTTNDFTNPVIYTAVALSTSSKTSTKDINTGTYTVTVIVAANTQKAINSFSLSTTPGSIGTPGVITGQNISVIVPFGTPVTALIATFTTSGTSVLVGGTPQTSGTTPNNFTSPVSYVVTAADGTTATYIVTVTVAADSAKAITAFSLGGTPGIITGQNIAVTMPFGTSLADLVATFTTSGANVSINGVTQVSGDTHNNFTSPVAYVVTAADGTTATYIVTATVAADFNKAITVFSLNGYGGVINESALTISVTVPYGTPITSMTAFYAQTGSEVLVNNIPQISGIFAAHDFTTPVTYVVRAADNTTASYTVNVIVSANTAKAITAFSINGYNGIINESALTIAVNIKFGTSLTALIAHYLTTGESVSVNGTPQTSDSTSNNFTTPLPYMVHAANGSTATYTVTVTNTANVWTWMSGTDLRNQNSSYGPIGIADPNNRPGARSDSISWTDHAGNLWFFGGRNGVGNFWNDLWKFTPESGTGVWTWVSGYNIADQYPEYGNKGAPSTSNIPGARQAGISWIDQSGTLWLFGGDGIDAGGGQGYLNDLWKYTPGTNEWTWVSGESATNGSGVYSGPSSVPGARRLSISWIDSSDNMWLFGGEGIDSEGADGRLNDLWKYTPGANAWTWIGGESTINGTGEYGNRGTPSTSNRPGARYSSISWIDQSGNLWLFGGSGRGGEGGSGRLNDLWKYTPGTNEWTWVSGSNTRNESGVYGVQLIPSVNNIPGGREASISWIDYSGNLWLFGGTGYDINGSLGQLNDLWKYNPGTNEWTWVSGSDVNYPDPFGIYNTLGIPNATSIAGGRDGGISWVDPSGDLWLFGGYGFPASGVAGLLNDLWRYHP